MYDAAGESTAGMISFQSGFFDGRPDASYRKIYNWQAPSGTYTSLVLKVRSSCDVDPGTTGAGCGIAYTLDGLSYTMLRGPDYGSWGITTDSIPLSPGQNLANIRFSVCAQSLAGYDPDIDINGVATVTVWDIRTEGVLSPQAPAAPSNLGGSAVSNGLSVSLTWTDNSNNETGFKLERCQGSGCSNFAWRADIASNATSTSDATAACTTYNYRLYAYGDGGSSGYSNTSQVSTPCAPSAPSNLTASNPETGGVSLSWTAGSGQTSYYLERCQGEGCSNFVQISTPSASATNTTDNTVAYGNTYSYRIRGGNAVGYSGYSNVASAPIFNGSYSLGTPFTTKYQYDVLGNLTCVEQHGNAAGDFDCADAQQRYGGSWRVRRFTYNSLSQLTQAKNPESGTIAYTYDVDGNVQTKTDARGITITYGYDGLHRVTGKTYSNGEPAVAYVYDASTYNGITIGDPLGRRVGMSDGSGTTAWSYDPLGRTLREHRTIAGVTKDIFYDPNLDGSLASITYPSGRVVTYAPGGAGRALSAIDQANSINYAMNAMYAPHGGLASLRNGAAPIITTNTYNKRLQPLTLSAATGTNTVMSLTYDFHLNTANNGNVYAITDNRDGLDPNRPLGSVTYVYDALNRLTSASTAGTDCSVTPSGLSRNWGNSYILDPWGNLTNKAVTKCTAENLNQAVNAYNQFTGGGRYDAAGNMVENGLYSYDAESRLSAAAGLTYSYDGDGRRVKKSSGPLYWYGGSG